MARNPIVFQNGTLIQKGTVEIDGNIYEVEPAQYQGNTPLSANNLNQLQENLYDYIDEEIDEINTSLTELTDNVYIKDNYAKISANKSVGAGISYLSLNLPTGFTKNNCFVIGYQWRIGSSDPVIAGNSVASGTSITNNVVAIYYTSNGIEVAFNNITSATFTFYIDILLMKIS